MRDLRTRLNERHKDSIVFSRAGRDVVAGRFGLEDFVKTGNQKVAKEIYLSTGPRHEARADELVTGDPIVVGASEPIGERELRCYAAGRAVCVALFRGTQRCSMELCHVPRTPASDGSCDEGLFTWFGPVEWIGTPWSDNDPSQCQCVTVQDLRDHAYGSLRDPLDEDRFRVTVQTAEDPTSLVVGKPGGRSARRIVDSVRLLKEAVDDGDATVRTLWLASFYGSLLVRRDPDLSVAARRLADVRRGLGREAFRRRVRQHGVASHLASLHADLHRRGDAPKLLARVTKALIDVTNDEDVLLAALKRVAEDGSLEPARRLAQAILVLAPGHPKVAHLLRVAEGKSLALMAAGALQGGSVNVAEPLLRTALRHNPEDRDSAHALAKLLWDAGRPQDWPEGVRLALESGDAKTLYRHAHECLARKDCEGARARLHELLCYRGGLPHENHRAVADLLMVLNLSNRPDQALREYERHEERSERVYAHALRSCIQQQGKEATLARGRGILADAVTRFPKRSDPLLARNAACLHAQRGEAKPALEWVAEAIRLEPALAQELRDDPELVSLHKEPRFAELLSGSEIAPEPEPTPRACDVPQGKWASCVAQIVRRFEAGHHPSDLFVEMNEVKVADVATVDALERGLASTEWRARLACAEALGRTSVERPRVAMALAEHLQLGRNEHVAERAAESLASLGRHAAGAIPRLVEAIEARERFDVWGNRWLADALLELAPHAKDRLAVTRLVGKLLAPAEEKFSREDFYGYGDFVKKAKKVLRRLGRRW